MGVRNAPHLYARLLPAFAFMKEKERIGSMLQRGLAALSRKWGEGLRCGSQVSLFPSLAPQPCVLPPRGHVLGRLSQLSVIGLC